MFFFLGLPEKAEVCQQDIGNQKLRDDELRLMTGEVQGYGGEEVKKLAPHPRADDSIC